MRPTLTRGIAAAVLLVAALLASLRPPRADGSPPPPLYVPGRIAVRFRPGSAALRTLAGAPGFVAGRPARAVSVAPRRVDMSNAGERLSRTARIELAPGADVVEAAAEWAGRPEVEWAAPVRLIPVESTGLPADPDLASQWFHDAIGSRDAWQVTTGDSTVVVGIVDTGVDYNHPDLKHNLWVNAVEAGGVPGVDDDHNGYVDDVIGYDFTDVPELDGAGDFTGRDPDPMDEIGHGTWVAGVICASGNNGIGGAGVAFGARFMPLRAGFRTRNGFSLGFLAEDDAAAAVVYGADNGAQILNLSFGDQLRSPILEDAVRYALDRGVLVVAAAGNSGDDLPFYPAALAGVLAVGASDRNGDRAAYSTWGPAVDLLAPGNGIFTTDIGTGYATKSGTSLAAPVVSGAAALLRSLHPDWPPSQVIGRLVQSARAASSGADAHGARLLDIASAVHDPADASISLPGLDDGSSFDREIVISGTIQGAGVRGWQVLARRNPGERWTRLAAEARSVAVDDTLVRWNVTDLSEGTALLRVDALGWDGPVLSRDVQVTIDHSPPVVSDIEVLPVRTGASVGIRLVARSDDEVIGDLKVTSSRGSFEFRSVLAAHDVVLGLDGPLCPTTGERVSLTASFVNAAGLTTTHDQTLLLPEVSETTTFRRHAGPVFRTMLPVLVDLDGDGRPEVVGELPAPAGSTYGNAAACSASAGPCDTCAWNFARVWESSDRFLPRDAADFDGDGVPDLLGLAFQEIRVYTHSSLTPFPDSLGWSLPDAWPARFIPAPDGAGYDIVASRDSEIRIYRRNGSGLALRQAIPDPTGGDNAVSPEIRLVHASFGLALAVLDGDRDLIVVARGPDGLFRPQWSRRLAADFTGDLAAGDLDGDGVDELMAVEAVGEMPSPSAALRDGFYRVAVFRDDGDGGYELSPEMSVAAGGQFPGNPVSLATGDLDGDDRAELWWGLPGHLYAVRWNQRRPEFLGAWEGVEPGAAAFGIAGAGPAARGVAIFPGSPAGAGSPGTLLELSTAPVPVALSPCVGAARHRGPAVEVELRWNNAAPPFLLSRRRADGPDLDFEIPDLAAATFRDTTLVPDATYMYEVRSAVGGPSSSLKVRAHVGNRIVSAEGEPGGLAIQWEFPVHMTERAAVRADGVAISSMTIDRSGRRLLIRTGRPIPGGPVALNVTGFESDPAFSVGPSDSSATVTLTAPVPRFSLRSVQVIDRDRLRLEFDPGAPIDAKPADFQIDPDLRVRQVVAAGSAIELVLDPATPLRTGRYRLRVSAGLRGPAGAVIETGAGDALAFSVTPIVFPNPVRADGAAVFQWLSRGARVSVHDLLGRQIWSGVAANDGILRWDLTDSSGRKVAPGMYLFEIEGIAALEGKLAVVR